MSANTAREKCPDCLYGEIPQEIKCSYCKGTGSAAKKPCGPCRGTGVKTLWHKCRRCYGSGEVEVGLNTVASHWPRRVAV